MNTFDFVDLSDWTILRISGPDDIKYLNGIVTLDVNSINPNETKRCAFLTPKGKIRSIFWIEKVENGLIFYCPNEMRENIISDLLKFKHNVNVKIEDIKEELPSLYLAKSNNQGILGFDTENEFFSFQLIKIPPKDNVINYENFKNWLIRNGSAPPEVLLDNNPYEVGINDAISLEKGCFLGQEPLSRMYHRGKPRKYLYQIIILGEFNDNFNLINNIEVSKIIAKTTFQSITYIVGFIQSNIDVDHDILSLDNNQIISIKKIGYYPQIKQR